MSRPASLLAVLTPSERAQFFPDAAMVALREFTPAFQVLDPTVLVPETFARQLEAIDPEVILSCWATPALPAALPPRLRYVCHLTGSIKFLVCRGQLEGGLLFTNWGDSISRTVAECALFHILACLRQATHWTLQMHRDGGWRDSYQDVRSLFERRIGLHGFGAVARALVPLVRPFGCKVSVFAPDVDEALANAHGVVRASSLDELFAENDVVVELVPVTQSTVGLVTERHLRLIRPGGVFVNVGRAATVDEAALLRIAREGKISVGLDVFANEPLPADSAFRGLANVSLTPHIAGPTFDRSLDATEHALRNLRAYAAGLPLVGVITPERYDQSA